MRKGRMPCRVRFKSRSKRAGETSEGEEEKGQGGFGGYEGAVDDFE